MKLSLMIPTFRSADTIERTLSAALWHRATVRSRCSSTTKRATTGRARSSRGSWTRPTVDRDPSSRLPRRTPAPCRPGGSLLHDDHRRLVLLRLGRRRVEAGVTASQMMAEAGRARAAAGRVLVGCSGEVEADGTRHAVLRGRQRGRDGGRVLGRDVPPADPADPDLCRLRDCCRPRRLRSPHQLRESTATTTTSATRTATTSGSCPSSRWRVTGSSCSASASSRSSTRARA